MMENVKTKQRGAGTLFFILQLLLIGIVVYLAIIIVPCYIGNYSVNNALSALAADKTIVNPNDDLGTTTNNVRNYLAKQFRISDVTSVPLQNIRVYRAGTSLQVQVDYEVRSKLIANIDIVVSFSDSINL